MIRAEAASPRADLERARAAFAAGRYAEALESAKGLVEQPRGALHVAIAQIALGIPWMVIAPFVER